MSAHAQMTFPFASLDFEGYTILTVDQVAAKIGKSSKHILNLIEEGELCALDLKGKLATRRDCRIPLEAYRAFVLSRMTGQMRSDFIRTLPRAVRMELLKEIQESLRSL